MTISNEQIEAAIGAMVRQQPALASGFGADELHALARAALEAGEAAAWSTDFDYAPQDGTDIAAETNDGLVLSVHGKEGEWTNGRHVISGLKRWAHLPTPPTEGDR